MRTGMVLQDGYVFEVAHSLGRQTHQDKQETGSPTPMSLYKRSSRHTQPRSSDTSRQARDRKPHRAPHVTLQTLIRTLSHSAIT